MGPSVDVANLDICFSIHDLFVKLKVVFKVVNVSWILMKIVAILNISLINLVNAPKYVLM